MATTVYPYPFNQQSASKFLDGSGNWQEVYNKTQIDQINNGRNLKEVTYSQLSEIKSGGNLEPGMFYRITDYSTTTTQLNTRSANHLFDIVVLALDESKLSENAYAMHHEGDSYFENADLSAWQLKYTMENDTSKYQWADSSSNGKGVIYYMKDEWGNECHYDFKNIQFKRWPITRVENSSNYSFSPSLLTHLSNSFVAESNGGKYFGAKNLNGNWVSVPVGLSITRTDSVDPDWYYTFTGITGILGNNNNLVKDEIYDISTTQFKLSQECIDWLANRNINKWYSDICRDNVIEAAFGETNNPKLRLNNNVFINGLSYCYYDENNSTWELSTSQCFENKIGVSSENNTIGSGFVSNVCGSIFSNNLFGDNVSYNTFGNNSDINAIAYGFFENYIGNGFGSNTFGSNIGRNSFGCTCFYNVITEDFRYNTIGNDAQSNVFSTNNWYNILGNGCRHNYIASQCWNNTFGNAVLHFSMPKPYSWFNIIENGNSFITLTSASDTDNSHLLRNIRIAQGTNHGNVESDRKTITHSTLSATCTTVYQSNGSTAVNV